MEKALRTPAREQIQQDADRATYPATGTSLTEGDLVSGQSLTITAESDQLVLFGDGIETDATPLTWGQTASIHLATRTLRLLR